MTSSNGRKHRPAPETEAQLMRVELRLRTEEALRLELLRILVGSRVVREMPGVKLSVSVEGTSVRSATARTGVGG